MEQKIYRTVKLELNWKASQWNHQSFSATITCMLELSKLN